MIFCEYEIEPGEKKEIQLPVPQAAPLNVHIFCGSHKGKTLVITAGVHGCEYVGIEAAKRLEQLLDPAQLHGNVILLPLINVKGFLEGRKQLVPDTGGSENLNRAFPGNLDGTLASRMAYVIEQSVYPHADFLIDLHSGDISEALIPLVFYPAAGTAAVNAEALEAAKKLSVPYRVKSTARNGLYSWAVQKQIPAILIERGANGFWSESEVSACLEDIFRIMAHLGIHKASYPSINQTQIEEAVYEEASSDGFWYPKVLAGQHVRSGELLGCFQNFQGTVSQEICAEFDGTVLYYTTALGVSQGELLIAYGR